MRLRLIQQATINIWYIAQQQVDMCWNIIMCQGVWFSSQLTVCNPRSLTLGKMITRFKTDEWLEPVLAWLFLVVNLFQTKTRLVQWLLRLGLRNPRKKERKTKRKEGRKTIGCCHLLSHCPVIRMGLRNPRKKEKQTVQSLLYYSSIKEIRFWAVIQEHSITYCINRTDY